MTDQSYPIRRRPMFNGSTFLQGYSDCMNIELIPDSRMTAKVHIRPSPKNLLDNSTMIKFIHLFIKLFNLFLSRVPIQFWIERAHGANFN